ncbi:NAD-dependent epimerase/dehydratase family protein [Flavobacterium soli]|uniref:NAD-dependent epimerase/dehydratase family protein n=1 Tax=Flavobacterium soli TaxID=344881 RepID=UPI00041D6F7E|nr:NAD-dependent epimerase/dehydratase family protein [Flavobacterium soli]
MNIGIVGCNGFIGKHLSVDLSQNKNISLKLFGRSDTNNTTAEAPYFSFNIENTADIIKNFEGLDLIYYLASDSIPITSWENPKIEIEKNLLPFLDFLELANKSNVKKVVFISSAGTIYGCSSESLNENANKSPFSPYGINKLTMEYYLNYHQEKNNLQFDIFRVSNIYGENQQTNKGLGIINTFLENIVHKKDIKVYGNGEAIRNYIYIKDVVRFIKTSIETDLSVSSIYNLCSNDNLSINQLLKLIKSTVSEDYKIIYIEQRNSDNPFIALDNSKIKLKFPLIQFTSMTEGIERCYIHIKNTIKV